MAPRQLAEFKAAREGLLDAFSGRDADADHVVVRLHARGTHRGDGLGMPPSNRRVDFRVMTWFTFRNCMTLEGWDSWNLGRLLESLKK